ncbi:hypothetical protein L6R53_23325 [Myxococcota bacterium]|nr:hypothetical protein [Myxococcota bacterium]
MVLLLLSCTSPPQLLPSGRWQPSDPVDGETPPLAAGLLPGDLTVVNTQTATAFCARYDELGGSLSVEGSALASLSELSCLRAVHGQVVVSSSTLESLDLPALEWVGGALDLSQAPFLALADFSALEQVGGLWTPTTEGLTSLPAFPGLTTVEGDLGIEGPDSLETASLTTLETVGGTLRVAGPGLQVIDLPALRSVGALELDGLASLPDLDGLAGLEAVTGTLSITDCDALEDLDGLAALSSWGGLVLTGDDSLAHFDRLGHGATDLEQVWLEDVPALYSIAGLDGVETVAGDLGLKGLDTLTALPELAALRSVGGSLTLDGLDQLASLDDLSALESVGGLYLHDLDTTDLSPLEGIAPDLSGSLYLHAGFDLAPLAHIETVGGNLTLYQAYRTDTSLPALRQVGGSMRLDWETDELSLPLLEEVGGDLTLEGNQGQALRLESLRRVGGTLQLSLDALDTLELGPLEEVGGDLLFSPSGSSALDTLTLDGLSEVGGSLQLGSYVEAFAAPDLLRIRGDLQLSGIDDLEELDLSSLDRVDGGLDLSGFWKLEELDGLEALRIIGLGLEINATGLDSLDGLYGVEWIGGNLAITNNWALTPMDVAGFFDAVGAQNVAGQITVQGNGG